MEQCIGMNVFQTTPVVGMPFASKKYERRNDNICESLKILL